MGLKTQQVADTYITMKVNTYPHPAWQNSLTNRRRTTTSCQQTKEPIQSATEIIKEFLRDTSLHGVKYTIQDDLFVYRILWILAVLTCVVCALYFMARAWTNFFESPILTTVRNANYPLYDIYFPAVTICPGFNIKKRMGLDMLYSKYHKTFIGRDVNTTLIHLMRALTFFRYPYYHLMEPDLAEIEDSSQFDTLNISDFMMAVLPTNEELFHSCKWQGKSENCKEIFDLQRYEGGFCYSFNSLTSMRCRRRTKKCLKDILSNAAAGTTSGLEIFLKRRNIEDHLGEGDQDAKGVSVMIHDPSELPQAGNGLFIMENQTKIGIIKIFASITTSSESMRSMAPNVRNCYFEDELSLVITHEYSQEDCQIECRLRYIEHKCGCQPYFFDFPEDRWKECPVSKLQCIIGESYNLKFTEKIIKELDSSEKSTCLECLPSCNNINYDVNAIFTEESKPIKDNTLGYLNVYYNDQSAVEYFRVMAIDRMQLLVSVGGIAGLFLGFSILSLFEIIYYFCRWISVIIKDLCSTKQSANTSIEEINSRFYSQNYREYPQEISKFSKTRRIWLFE